MRRSSSAARSPRPVASPAETARWSRRWARDGRISGRVRAPALALAGEPPPREAHGRLGALGPGSFHELHAGGGVAARRSRRRRGIVPSLDALLDPLQVLAVTATRIRGVDLGTSVTESIRRHPMSLAQSFVTLDHIAQGAGDPRHRQRHSREHRALRPAVRGQRRAARGGAHHHPPPVGERRRGRSTSTAASGGSATRSFACRSTVAGARASSSRPTIRACCGSRAASATAGCPARR